MRKALVIGIDEYPVDPLQFCVNDAATLAEILRSNGDNSPNFEVRLETNVKTKSELVEKIGRLFEGSPDVVLLYFAGHGCLNSTGGVIMTPDFKKHDEGVTMDHVLKLASNSQARNKVIILDCCKSGAMGTPTLSNESAAELKTGLTILSACRDSGQLVK